MRRTCFRAPSQEGGEGTVPYDIRQSELKPTQKLIVFQMTELTYEGGTLVAERDGAGAA